MGVNVVSACPEVAIKRQPTGSNTAREVAAYTMLRAFPHPNRLRMHDCFWKADQRGGLPACTS